MISELLALALSLPLSLLTRRQNISSKPHNVLIKRVLITVFLHLLILMCGSLNN